MCVQALKARDLQGGAGGSGRRSGEIPAHGHTPYPSMITSSSFLSDIRVHMPDCTDTYSPLPAAFRFSLLY